VIYAPESGEGATVALQRSLTLSAEGELSDDFDPGLVQDSTVSFQLADYCSSAPRSLSRIV
jgi:hypothetical protein